MCPLKHQTTIVQFYYLKNSYHHNNFFFLGGGRAEHKLEGGNPLWYETQPTTNAHTVGFVEHKNC